MNNCQLAITHIGGPTALLEFGGLRLLTDPTFDPAGGEYRSGPVTLRKLSGPALSPESMSPFDYVLLSHDHHFDNLDHSGRVWLAKAKTVLTTPEGASRLGGNSLGLQPWQSVDLQTAQGRVLRVIATPARHGPEGLSRERLRDLSRSLSTLPSKPSTSRAIQSGTRELPKLQSGLPLVPRSSI